MKAVILAGGYGTRISDNPDKLPKPMVEIGGKPILWHIMKIYEHHGINDFVVCCGYKSSVIKKYFYDYYLHATDIHVDLSSNRVVYGQRSKSEKWRISLVDTGLDSMTGHRIKQIQPEIGDDDFCLTYGDGLSDVNISEAIEFHKSHNKIATVTAVRNAGRFGTLNIDNNTDTVMAFAEKPVDWINGGFFVLSTKVFDLLSDDVGLVWEKEPLQLLASMGELKAYKHSGFWHAMDTMSDHVVLENMWTKKEAKWKVWQ